MEYISEDGEEGYPCKLTTICTYTLSKDILNVRHEAWLTDENELRQTIVNITNHAYFNLTGGAERQILNHYLQIPSQLYIPLNDYQIPMAPIFEKATPELDFSKYRTIRSHPLDAEDAVQYIHDHCYILATPEIVSNKPDTQS